MALDYERLFSLAQYRHELPRVDLYGPLAEIAGQIDRRNASGVAGSAGATALPLEGSVGASSPPLGGRASVPAPTSYGASEGAGRGSWYSQAPGWVDRMDKPGSNALGVPDTEQGIALPTRATLGKTFEITTPDGRTVRARQTDVGPAKWTGKSVDISAALASKLGYSPQSFPTGGSFKWRLVD